MKRSYGDSSCDELPILSVYVGVTHPHRDLSEADLGFDISELPKSWRREFGVRVRLHVYPEKALKPFFLLRGELLRNLERQSLRNPTTPATYSFIASHERMLELREQVLAIKRRYDEARANLLDRHDAYCEQAIEAIRDRIQKEAPEFPHLDALLEAVRRAQPKRDYLQRQLRIRYTLAQWQRMKRVNPDEERDSIEGWRATLDTIVGAALDQAAEWARKILSRRSALKELQPKTVTALERVADVLGDVAFLDPSGSLREVSAALGACLAAAPREGLWRGESLQELLYLLQILRHPEEVHRRVAAGERLYTPGLRRVGLTLDLEPEAAPRQHEADAATATPAETDGTDGEADETRSDEAPPAAPASEPAPSPAPMPAVVPGMLGF